MMLAVESSMVIAMRMTKLMSGDADNASEVVLMIGEKIDAAIEATSSLVAGASNDEIVNRYRQLVAVNARGLGNRGLCEGINSIFNGYSYADDEPSTDLVEATWPGGLRMRLTRRPLHCWFN